MQLFRIIAIDAGFKLLFKVQIMKEREERRGERRRFKLLFRLQKQVPSGKI